MNFRNSFQIVSSDRPKFEKTPDGFLRCKARVLAERIMPYSKAEFDGAPTDCPDVIKMLVTRDSMSTADSLRSLEGAAVVIGEHNWVSPDVIKQFGVGSVAGAPVMDGPYLVCDLLITDPAAIEGIDSGEFCEISAAYLADSIFEAGDFDGQPYDAKQVQLRYNHIAVIPAGHGRAGSDVRIINKKDGGTPMSEKTMVRVQLKNTGKFVNVDEEGAAAVEAESTASGAKLEESMAALEEKNGDMSSLQAEIEELKGELSVYKEKLDQLLSTEAVEEAAAGMVEEAGEAEEIVENMAPAKEEGEEEFGKRKDEIKNSIKGVYGTALHTKVLAAVGVKCENMSNEALKGAFKAHHQIITAMGPRKAVAGQKMMNANKADGTGAVAPVQRTSRERLGFK